MAAKEASVKLTLDGSSYLVAIKRVGDLTEKAAKSGQTGFLNMKRGVDAAKRSLGDLASGVGNVAKMALTLGGAFSFGTAVTDAVKLQSTYKNLAFSIEAGTGKATSWTAVQADLQGAADRTGRTTEEMGAAFAAVFRETGNAEDAKAALDAIGTAATASGHSVEQVANVVAVLGDKFGITGAQAGGSLATLLQLANQGGVSFEEMDRILNMTGASARAAGMSGAEGFSTMIALMNKGGDALGSMRKALSAVPALIDQMADPAVGKQIKQNFGVDVKTSAGQIKSANDVLAGIMAKTQGDRAKLGKVFKGEQLKVVTELGAPFRKAFEETSGDVATKTKAGLDAFSKSLTDAGKGAKDEAWLRAKAAERANDPERKLAQAKELLTRAFEKPEMIRAIEDLAAALPKLAKYMAKALSFAVEHPALAAGLVGGAKVGGAFLGGAMEGVGRKIAAEIGASAVGRKIAAGFAGGIAGPTIGLAIGTAAGAAYLAAIDKLTEEKARMQTETAINMAVSGEGGSIEQARERLPSAQAEVERMEARGKPGFWEQGLMGAADLGAALGLTDVIKDPMEQWAEDLERAKNVRDTLQARIDAAPDPGAPGAPAAPVKPPALPPAQAPTGKVRIENPNDMSAAFVRAISGGIKVEVTKMPAQPGAGGGRGAPGAPPAAPGAEAR